MRMIPSPDAASSEMIRWTSTLAPMSIPRVGSSRIRILGFEASHLARTTFCWLPPGQGPHQLVDAGHPDVELPRVVVGDLAFSRRANQEAREDARKDRQGHVLGDRKVQHEALLVAILGQVRDPGIHRRRRTHEGHCRSADENLAAIPLVDPEQDPRHLRAAGPDEAGEADDLSGTDRKPDVSEYTDPRQAPDLEQDLADRCLDLREEGHRPSDHVADEVGGGELAGGGRDDVPAVSEDCRPVAQVEDLVEAVTHEQDRHAAVAKPTDDREQAVDLVGGQRRGRLVEDEDSRLDGQRLRNLDQLLVGHREATDRRVRRRTARPVRGRALPPPGASRPSRSIPSRPDGAWPMKTFSATVRSGNRRGSWWTTAIPRERAWAGPWICVGSPSSMDRPAVGLMNAGEDLDEGALARRRSHRPARGSRRAGDRARRRRAPAWRRSAWRSRAARCGAARRTAGDTVTGATSSRPTCWPARDPRPCPDRGPEPRRPEP